MKRSYTLLGTSLLLAIILQVFCYGQRTSANISGVVTDPSGAVIPGAHATIIDANTGTTTGAQANDQGVYVISNLQPGAYSLRVEAPGFQGVEQKGIVIQVGQFMTVNVAMKMGTEIQQVVVTTQPALVGTNSQTVSYAITPQLTGQLPLNGRNVLQLLALAPDASAHNPAADNYSNEMATRPETAGSGFVTASGEARENSTTYYLDGGLDEDTYTDVANVFPNPDAVEEFTVDTNSYNAKFGGRGGAVVNAVTRGGTNNIHGSLFEYLRNGYVNASNYFATSPDTLKRNQFGFSVGGPVLKDKLFWFGSWQRTTFRYGSDSNIAFGPTAAELDGDWSGSVTPGTQLTNPLTGQAFPGNRVPVSDYAPVSLKLLTLVPKGDPVTGQFNYLMKQLQNDDQYVARVDYHLGDRATISASYLWDQFAQPNLADPRDIVTGGANETWTSQHAALNIAYRFSNNLLTTVSATLSRAVLQYAGSSQFAGLAQLGANYPVWDPKGVYEVGFDISGWFSAQWLGAQNATRNQEDLVNNWTWTHGGHTLDFGGELPFYQSVLYQAYSSSGYQGWWCANSGSASLDFMLGTNCYFEQYAPSYVAPRGVAPGLYANDSWRVNHRVTLNLGARWEPWLPWPDASAGKIGGQINLAAYAAGIHSSRYPNLPPGFLVRGDPGVPSGLASPDWKLIDPRVGVAWDVFGDGKTSIRSGFGIYHDQPFGRMYNEMTSTEPFTEGAVIEQANVSAYDPYAAPPYNGVIPPLQNPPSSNTLFILPLTNAVGFDPNFKPPVTMQWNLTVEHQLPAGVLLRAGYEGARSYHMYDSRDLNAATNFVRPMTAGGFGGTVIVDESKGISSYNALAISVEKRMTHNLSFLGGYRWAKCLDIAGSVASFAFNEFTDAKDPNVDYGRCDSDLAQQYKLAGVWQTPAVNSLGFAGRQLLGGWLVSGILSSYDGFPFSVIAVGDANEDGTVDDRANLVGNPNLGSGRSHSQQLAEWFNTAAFQTPIDADGSSGRNILRGPGFFNLDMALVKTFSMPFKIVSDTQKIEFRTEAFNLPNHPNFENPDNAMGDGLLFGTIHSAASPRVLQFALKYTF